MKDSFLNEVKNLLSSKSIELMKVESFDIKQVFARVNIENKEYMLAAFNKKKIEDSDLIKASKKAGLLGVDYYILSRGDMTKKTKESVDAYKKLAGTLKILVEEKSRE